MHLMVDFGSLRETGHTSTLDVSIKVFPERLRFESED